jgi:hypothetical protein
MTTGTHQIALLLAFAVGLAACGSQSPSGPTALPRAAATAPGVTSISPSTGSTSRPTRITITGAGFLAGARVMVDVTAVSITVVSSTTITATVPPHASGPADILVINPDGLVGTLPAAFTYLPEEPFTVTPSADAVDAGGRMTVSWTAPSARAGDWLALFKVGASYDDDWWGDTNGAVSGTLTVVAPTRPGQYEFRYLSEGSLLDVARSSQVTVR